MVDPNDDEDSQEDSPYTHPVDELENQGKTRYEKARNATVRDARRSYERELTRKRRSYEKNQESVSGGSAQTAASQGASRSPSNGLQTASGRSGRKWHASGSGRQENETLSSWIRRRVRESTAHLDRLKLCLYGSIGLFTCFLFFSVLISLFALSPFGIFFSGESNEKDAVPLAMAIHTVNEELNGQLEPLQHEKEYDAVHLSGDVIDWMEVLALYAAQNEEELVYTFTEQEVENLSALYWSMVQIESEVKRIPHVSLVTTVSPSGKSMTSYQVSYTRELYITITCKDAGTRARELGLKEKNLEAMEEILAQKDSLGDIIGSTSVIDKEAKAAIKRLPLTTEENRYLAVKKACSLVGKVSYFWGGKSYAEGWDSRWGQLRKVTAEGGEDTGCYMPYGLDCTGYLSWVFWNTFGSGSLQGTSVAWERAQVGDLVYTKDEDHVGMILEMGTDGPIKVIHCARGSGGVAITDASLFDHAVSPAIYNQ